MPRTPAPDGASPAQLIDSRIAEHPDWRGDALAKVRSLILKAEPGIAEEWKWGVPVWSLAGILCTGEVYKAAVKLTFPKGASVPDPQGLFNASLDGAARRAIDIRQGDVIDEAAFSALIRAAVAVNRSKPPGRT